MKTILAYGDSLTWGFNARTMRRHPHEDQWPAVLEKSLGQGVRVVNAGLGGRTTMFDDHAAAADRNGARILPTILATFEPVDLVILMLGTNDLKLFTGGSAIAAAQGMRRLIEIVKTFPYESRAVPAVLVVSPPLVEQFGPSASLPLMSPRVPEAGDLAAAYSEVARIAGARFFDAAAVASPENGGDGVHLDAANTRAIGRALVPVVGSMLDLNRVEVA